MSKLKQQVFMKEQCKS